MSFLSKTFNALFVSAFVFLLPFIASAEVINNFALYERNFLYAFLFTQIVEISVVFILIRRIYKHEEINVSKIIFIGFIASALTLPYLWFILPFYIFNKTIYVIIGESLVILAETIIYNQLLKIKLSESFKISLAANASSFLFGLFIL